MPRQVVGYATTGLSLGVPEPIDEFGTTTFPMQLIMDHPEWYVFTEKPGGVMCIEYNKTLSSAEKHRRQEAESQLIVTLTSGHQCSKEGCERYAPRACAHCLTTAYCSLECRNEDWETHKETCKAIVSFTKTPFGERFLELLRTQLTVMCKRFYDIMNASRCTRLSPEKLETYSRKELYKALKISQVVLFRKLEQDTKRIPAAIESSNDIHRSWARADIRYVLGKIFAFVGRTARKL